LCGRDSSQGLHNAIDFSLGDSSGARAVLLTENELHTVGIRVQVEDKSIPGTLGISLLESLVGRVLIAKIPLFASRDSAMDLISKRMLSRLWTREDRDQTSILSGVNSYSIWSKL